MKVALILALVIAVAVAEYRPNKPSYAPSYQTYEKGMPYSFAYSVDDDYSGNNYGHKEQSDGYGTTGEYGVNLPDGRIQVVKYRADENGYVADVSYIGEAKYEKPAYEQSNRPPYAGSGYRYKPSYEPKPSYQDYTKPGYKSAYTPTYPRERPVYTPAYVPTSPRTTYPRYQ